MLTLNAKIRKIKKKKVKKLRKNHLIPSVLYGPEIKSENLEVDYLEFEKLFKNVGFTSLIKLKVQGKEKNFLTLIHKIQKHSLSGKIMHIDFYKVPEKREIKATIPLIFENTAPAVKELKGGLVKNIQELPIKCLAKILPKEIKVDISSLKTFKDEILIKDIVVPDGVKILKKENEVVALVLPAMDIQKELEKPIEEKIPTEQENRESEKNREEEKERLKVKEKREKL